MDDVEEGEEYEEEDRVGWFEKRGSWHIELIIEEC